MFLGLGLRVWVGQDQVYLLETLLMRESRATAARTSESFSTIADPDSQVPFLSMTCSRR